jgi:hypothetical protein
MNSVSIVMQCYFFPFFSLVCLEFLVMGKRIKQNLKFCENMVY